MSHQPLISVVVPTRNRGRLLRSALQSVLDQSFDDYELIVSNNDSTDDTNEVVNQFQSPKLRYLKTDRTLSMPEHWEFALEQARGRYVTYLCDDDAWAPSALARAAEVLTSTGSALAVFCSAVYYAPDWLEPNLRNTLHLPSFTGEVHERGSVNTIRKLFDTCRVEMECPRMLNSICDLQTLQNVRRKAGTIFALCPDYSFAAIILTAVPSWLYIDQPLHVQGVFPEGIGSAQVFNRGEAAREFDREFGAQKLLRRVPLSCKVVSNYITETLLLCQEQLPELSSYRVNWAEYLVSCWTDLMVLERNGVDVSADKIEWRRFRDSQGDALRDQLANDGRTIVRPPSGPSSPVATVRAAARRVINSSSVLARLESLVRGPGGGAVAPPSLPWISGSEAGFSNILECARRLPELAGKNATTTAG